MNASYRMAVLSLAILGLAACAGSQTKSTYVPEPKPSSITDPDEAYIAYVERIAQRRGIEVVWVNSPKKSAAQVAEENSGK